MKSEKNIVKYAVLKSRTVPARIAYGRFDITGKIVLILRRINIPMGAHGPYSEQSD